MSALMHRTVVVRVPALRRCWLDLGAHGRVPFLVMATEVARG
jgi:hypothetical protein